MQLPGLQLLNIDSLWMLINKYLAIFQRSQLHANCLRDSLPRVKITVLYEDLFENGVFFFKEARTRPA